MSWMSPRQSTKRRASHSDTSIITDIRVCVLLDLDYSFGVSLSDTDYFDILLSLLYPVCSGNASTYCPVDINRFCICFAASSHGRTPHRTIFQVIRHRMGVSHIGCSYFSDGGDWFNKFEKKNDKLDIHFQERKREGEKFSVSEDWNNLKFDYYRIQGQNWAMKFTK